MMTVNSDNTIYPDMKAMVSFVISVNGKTLDAPFEIESVKIKKFFGRIAMAELVLCDGDVAEGKFELSDRDELANGQIIEIQAGYDFQYERIFRGVIVKHALMYSGQRSQLQIIAKNEAFKMTLRRSKRIYSDFTDSQMIESVIGNYSLKSEVDSTAAVYESLGQFDATDWDFINMRAENAALLIATEDDGLRVISIDNIRKGIPKKKLIHGSSILEMEVELDSRNEYTKYSAYSWNPASQEEEVVECDHETSDGNGGDKNIFINEPLYRKDMINEYLHSSISMDSLSHLVGTIKTLGCSDVYLGDLVELQRVGRRFNGKAVVTGIEHELSPGEWSTILYIGMKPEPFATKFDDIDSLKASGKLPPVNGLQIGTVVELEGDPLDEDRVQIQLHGFSGSNPQFWARLSETYAGGEKGIVFRPDIGDEVIVGFINDNPSNAVILGSMHSSKNVSPVEASSENQQLGIYTREKLKLEFDDKTKSITLETPGGNKMLLSDEDKGISIQDQNGNRIILNQEGITIESKKKLQLKAVSDLALKSENSLKAEANALAEFKSSGNAVIKGAMVMIN